MNIEPELFRQRISECSGLADVVVETRVNASGQLVSASCCGKTASVQIYNTPSAWDLANRLPPISSYPAGEIAASYSPALAEALQKELRLGRFDWTGKTVVCPEHWDEVMNASNNEFMIDGYQANKDETFLFTSEAKETCPICHSKEV